MNIWAFARTVDKEAIVKSINEDGVSRFGWGFKDSNNLTIEENFWNKENSRQRFLLNIQPEDWIVHVNLPNDGECIAAQVTSGYYFEILQEVGDFGHCFEIDKNSIIKFDRNDPNVLPPSTLPHARVITEYTPLMIF